MKELGIPYSEWRTVTVRDFNRFLGYLERVREIAEEEQRKVEKPSARLPATGATYQSDIG